jgi:hypothetical protein
LHEHQRCSVEVIASGPHGEVHVCRDCGAVHLHIGPFSLRLRADVYRSVCETLALSMRRLDATGPVADTIAASPRAKH